MGKKRNGKENPNVLAANKLADPLEAAGIFSSFQCSKNGLEILCSICHYKVGDMPKQLLTWVIDLMTRNMKELYASSSWGWDAKQKEQELSEDPARFLIVFKDEKPIAFTHFRFDMDFGRSVIYCYEIQVEPDVQSMKLGTHLVTALEVLAGHTKIPYIVLTVLLNNPRSCSFFRHLGYNEDETNLKDGNRDYLILSKCVS